jgi:hypothetical protein
VLAAFPRRSRTSRTIWGLAGQLSLQAFNDSLLIAELAEIAWGAKLNLGELAQFD